MHAGALAFFANQLGVLGSDLANFGRGGCLNVRLHRVQPGVVLVVIFGRIIRLERLERGDDRIRKCMGLIQLLNLGLGKLLLMLVGKEDGRAILGSFIVPWALSCVGS